LPDAKRAKSESVDFNDGPVPLHEASPLVADSEDELVEDCIEVSEVSRTGESIGITPAEKSTIMSSAQNWLKRVPTLTFFKTSPLAMSTPRISVAAVDRVADTPLPALVEGRMETEGDEGIVEDEVQLIADRTSHKSAKKPRRSKRKGSDVGHANVPPNPLAETVDQQQPPSRGQSVEVILDLKPQIPTEAPVNVPDSAESSQSQKKRTRVRNRKTTRDVSGPAVGGDERIQVGVLQVDEEDELLLTTESAKKRKLEEEGDIAADSQRGESSALDTSRMLILIGRLDSTSPLSQRSLKVKKGKGKSKSSSRDVIDDSLPSGVFDGELYTWIIPATNVVANLLRCP
jgi:hypothetical protein